MRWISLLSLASLALGSSKICANRIIKSSKQIQTPSGITINQTAFDCPGARIKPLTNADVGLTESSIDEDVEKRSKDASSCTQYPSNCGCGILCDTGTTCVAPRGPIVSTDCSSLGLALISMSGTFLVNPGQANGYSYKTCTFVVYNNQASTQEHCVNTLGNAGEYYLNPFCNVKEAFCGASTVSGISKFYFEQLATSAL